MINPGSGGLTPEDIAHATLECWIFGIAFFMIMSPFTLRKRFNIRSLQLAFWVFFCSVFWPVYLFYEFAVLVEDIEGGVNVDEEGDTGDMHELWVGADQGPSPVADGALQELRVHSGPEEVRGVPRRRSDGAPGFRVGWF